MVGADTAWIMVATALVLFMTLPGLALFYGGLVRSRNVLSVLMHCFSIACLMSILWLAVGYSIAFGDGNAYWGGLGKAFLLGVDADTLSGTIPEVLFFAFQMTFAIITPALIVGAYVERIGFGFVLVFSSLWMLLCYAPVAHWIWGGGLLAGEEWSLFENGVNDFAGGIVVHQTAGLAALVLAAFLGNRREKSIPSLTWILWERVRHGKASLIGLVTGTIAGLASITPASGSVDPVQALIIGSIAGVFCQLACGVVKNVLNIDDTLDVFAVHGVGGMFGIVMLVVFGHAGATEQLGGLLVVGVFTVVVTTILVFVTKLVTPLRVSEEEEELGLDLVAHGERAYNITS